MIHGYATPQGTAAYAARLAGEVAAGHFRTVEGLHVSSVGIGTYLGQPDAATDLRYEDAIVAAVHGGIDVLDTAINYRYQRSERCVGRAIARLLGEGIAREELFVCTKGGFLPGDADRGWDERRYFQEIVNAGVASWDDVVAGCHCIAPGYLRHQIAASRSNLGLETIDVYYLHNPETQRMGGVDRESFRARMRAAFAVLEEAVARGEIRWYGTATWEAYRQPPESPASLQLAELVALAREVAGEEHHFRFVQLPVNLAMIEAIVQPTQGIGGRRLPFLAAAQELGIHAIASASLLQAQLLGRLPAALRARFPSLDTDAQRALQFVRSTPGIVCALVGMQRVEHVRENLRVARVPPLAEAVYRALFGA